MLAEASFTGFPFPLPSGEEPSPVPLSNLVCWLDAGQGIALDGASWRVAAWGSRVGAVGATQGTPAAMPIFVASALNGLPGVRLDGADDYLEVAMPSGRGASCAVFVVASGFDGTAAYQTVISSGGRWRFQTNDVEFASGGAIRSWCPPGALARPALQRDDGSERSGRRRNGGGERRREPRPPVALDLGRNASAGGPDYGAATFHEALYYDALSSSSDTTRIRTYLARKWGLA